MGEINHALSLKIMHPHKKYFTEMVNACFDLQDEPLRMLSFFSLYCLIRDVALHNRIVFIGDGLPQD